MILAATGHRPNKLGGYSADVLHRLTSGALKYLRRAEPKAAISGMALGWDTAWAKAAIMHGIPLIAAVPFEGQDEAWPDESKKTYRDILARAAEVVVVCSGPYTNVKFQVRNEWMVDRCDKLVALWDGTAGGTANCVRYAHEMRRPVDNIWPQWAKKSGVKPCA